MLTYDLAGARGPLYQAIYQAIRKDILAGVLPAGEKLPSRRSFARQHGVSTITVQNAYDQLASEGYVYSLPKKGYYVAEFRDLAAVPAVSAAAAAAASVHISMPPAPEVWDVNLSDNRVDPEKFPFSVWARLCRETLSGRQKELMEIAPSGGVRELRLAIAEHLRSFRGMLVDPDQIVVGAGTEYLYGLIIQLLGSGLSYCTENPGYKKLLRIYERYGVSCGAVALDEKGISVEALEGSGADVAHISPNHHFPTGITMPVSRRYEVLAWASGREGRFVIEDDYDSEFRLNGKPVPTLFSMDTCGKVIYLNTFSKSLTPTIRISYMVLPAELAERFYEKLSFLACTVSTFEQYTLAAFIRQGYFEKHINRMRLHYGRLRRQLLDVFGQPGLAGICQVLESGAGMHFLIRLRTELSDGEVTEWLKARGVRIQALSEFLIDGSRAGTEGAREKISTGENAGAGTRAEKQYSGFRAGQGEAGMECRAGLAGKDCVGAGIRAEKQYSGSRAGQREAGMECRTGLAGKDCVGAGTRAEKQYSGFRAGQREVGMECQAGQEDAREIPGQSQPAGEHMFLVCYSNIDMEKTRAALMLLEQLPGQGEAEPRV